MIGFMISSLWMDPWPSLGDICDRGGRGLFNGSFVISGNLEKMRAHLSFKLLSSTISKTKDLLSSSYLPSSIVALCFLGEPSLLEFSSSIRGRISGGHP